MRKRVPIPFDADLRHGRSRSLVPGVEGHNPSHVGLKGQHNDVVHGAQVLPSFFSGTLRLSFPATRLNLWSRVSSHDSARFVRTSTSRTAARYCSSDRGLLFPNCPKRPRIPQTRSSMLPCGSARRCFSIPPAGCMKNRLNTTAGSFGRKLMPSALTASRCPGCSTQAKKPGLQRCHAGDELINRDRVLSVARAWRW